MPSTTRRALLRTGGFVTSASIAGCTELLGGADETRLTFLLFYNWTPDEQAITVRVDDDPSYRRTVPLDPHSTDVLPPDSFRPEGFPTEPGTFEVAFDLQGRDDEPGADTFALGEFDEECVGFTAEVTVPDEDDRPRLSVFPATGCDQGQAGNGTD